jgi:hypothetical protein
MLIALKFTPLTALCASRGPSVNIPPVAAGGRHRVEMGLTEDLLQNGMNCLAHLQTTTDEDRRRIPHHPGQDLSGGLLEPVLHVLPAWPT